MSTLRQAKWLLPVFIIALLAAIGYIAYQYGRQTQATDTANAISTAFNILPTLTPMAVTPRPKIAEAQLHYGVETLADWSVKMYIGDADRIEAAVHRTGASGFDGDALVFACNDNNLSVYLEASGSLPEQITLVEIRLGAAPLRMMSSREYSKTDVLLFNDPMAFIHELLPHRRVEISITPGRTIAFSLASFDWAVGYPLKQCGYSD